MGEGRDALAYAAAQDCLGRLNVTTLPDLATEALLAGVESEQLILLAGEYAATDPHELRALFEAALLELGMSEPSRLEAAALLKRRVARDVAEGKETPRDGAEKIVMLRFEIDDEAPDEGYVGSGFGIAELVGLFYAYDDVPASSKPEHAALVAKIDAEIREACERIAAPRRCRTTPGPRRRPSRRRAPNLLR